MRKMLYYIVGLVCTGCAGSMPGINRVACELGDRGYELEEQIRDLLSESFECGSIVDEKTGRILESRRFTFFKTFPDDTIYGCLWSSASIIGKQNYAFWNSTDTITFNLTEYGHTDEDWSSMSENIYWLVPEILKNGAAEFEDVHRRTIKVMRFIIHDNQITKYRIFNYSFDIIQL